MRAHIVEALEGFLERGEMWDSEAMEELVSVLEAETNATGDRIPLMLAKVFAAILLRMRMAPIDTHLAFDVQAHVYQRVYKVLEAAYDDLPDAELRTRIEVFRRRISRMIVDEDPRPVSESG